MFPACSFDYYARTCAPIRGLLVCDPGASFAEVIGLPVTSPPSRRIIDKGVATGDSGYIWRMGAFMLG